MDLEAKSELLFYHQRCFSAGPVSPDPAGVGWHTRLPLQGEGEWSGEVVNGASFSISPLCVTSHTLLAACKVVSTVVTFCPACSGPA